MLLQQELGTLRMRWIDTRLTGLLRPAFLLAMLGIGGCSLLPADPEPQALPEPVSPQPEIAVLPPLPAPAPTPRNSARVAAPLPPLPSLSIVLTSGVPAYAEVARELALRFENHDTYNLADDDRAPVNILRLVNDSDSGVIVAIGHRAAVASVAMANKPVVFSQVFNYQDLLADNSRGVAAIAPLDAQIAAWKELDPSVSRIGAIIGQGHDDLIAEAKLAAENNGVELLLHVAESDQETLFIFKRMIRNIDGYWLFPDNRVLSPRALQQIVSGARQQQVPVLVPSESMLAMGASVSISSVAADIAETITKVVRQIEAGEIGKVPAISPLSEIRVVTRDLARVADR